jgi:cytochrome c peroxidase
MTHRAIRPLTPLLVLESSTAMIAAVFVPNLSPFQDLTGAVATFNSSGAIDPSGAFFQSLGTNGRSCATCHRLDQAMSLSSRGVQFIYRQSHGNDPL